MQAFLKKVSINTDIVPEDALSKLDNGITEATTNANNRLEQFKAKYADIRNELAKSIKVDISLGSFDNEMDAMRTKFNSLSDANDDLRRSFEATEAALGKRTEMIWQYIRIMKYRFWVILQNEGIPGNG